MEVCLQGKRDQCAVKGQVTRRLLLEPPDIVNGRVEIGEVVGCGLIGFGKLAISDILEHIRDLWLAQSYCVRNLIRGVKRQPHIEDGLVCGGAPRR